MDAHTKDYVDKSMETVKAQNDARFSDVIARLDTLNSKVDHLPRPASFWSLAGLAASGLVVAFTLLAAFADRFDGGISAFGLLDKSLEEQRARDAAQDERVNKLIEAVETLATNQKSEP